MWSEAGQQLPTRSSLEAMGSGRREDLFRDNGTARSEVAPRGIWREAAAEEQKQRRSERTVVDDEQAWGRVTSLAFVLTRGEP